MKKVSLSDIADRLGISKTVVSLVLNGKGKESRISDELCERVMEVAKELNYHPNQIARGLRTGKTNTIGLIIADLANPFFGKLGREIENEAAAAGYRVMFCSTDENVEKFKYQLKMLGQELVDGLIISPPAGSEEQINVLEKSGKPYVLIDRYFPKINSNSVVIDNFQAAHNATTHLIKKGYRKIACITLNNDLINMKERLNGYKKALGDAAIDADENLIKILPFSHERNNIEAAIRELTTEGRRNADALFFTTSKAGILGLESIHSLGLSIPGDVAVVSFDDLDAYRISNPPVTAVAQPLKGIGEEAVRLLLEQINSKKRKNPRKRVVLKAKLIERKSSQP
ncbi:MAG: LacI family DNA-binding transcriptional regulator [Fermentimonas sp.]|jgi:LacI family transcriptional regulator